MAIEIEAVEQVRVSRVSRGEVRLPSWTRGPSYARRPAKMRALRPVRFSSLAGRIRKGGVGKKGIRSAVS